MGKHIDIGYFKKPVKVRIYEIHQKTKFTLGIPTNENPSCTK